MIVARNEGADGPIRSWMHNLPGELVDARQAHELRASGCRSTPRIVEPPPNRPALKADCDRRTTESSFGSGRGNNRPAMRRPQAIAALVLLTTSTPFGDESAGRFTLFRVVSRSQIQSFRRSHGLLQRVRFPAAPPRRPRLGGRSPRPGPLLQHLDQQTRWYEGSRRPDSAPLDAERNSPRSQPTEASCRVRRAG